MQVPLVIQLTDDEKFLWKVRQHCLHVCKAHLN